MNVIVFFGIFTGNFELGHISFLFISTFDETPRGIEN